MMSLIRSLLILSIILYLFSPSYGEEIIAEGPAENKTASRSDGRLVFFPELAIMLDGGLYLDNDFNYAAVTRRAFTIDILRYKNVVFSTGLNEVLTYREMGGVKYDPWLIHYDMDYFSLRWELKYFSAVYFMDHLCTNIINQEDVGLRELRWYGTGVRIETEGMRPGHRNAGGLTADGAFAFLNRLNYMLAAVYPLSNGANNRFRYDFLLKGILRYDVVRLYNLAPYIEGSFWGIIDKDYSRIRYDRSAEAGVRYRYYNIDMTPYISYTYKNDVEIYKGPGMNYYLIGFRLESVLYDYYKSENIADDMNPVLPEIHFAGQYAQYLPNDYRNVNHKLIIDIELFKINNFSVFAANGLRHDSTGVGGLYPRYMDVYGEAGARYCFDAADILIEPNYRYARLDDSNNFRGYRQRFETAGLRVKNLKMRTGYVNDGISFTDSRFQLLNKFGWQASANRFVRDYNYPYDWHFSLKLQWDILRKYLFIPYAGAEARCLKGTAAVWEFTSETGIRLWDRPQTIIFFEYVYRTKSDPANGIARNQSMLGLRIEL